MRRPSSVLLLSALALAALGFAPAAPAPPAVVVPAAPSADSATDAVPATDAAAAADASEIVICVRFRDWGIPGTGITFEKPAERFCVELPDVNPGMLPVQAGRA